MADFDLKKFLSTYKPKKLDLSCYQNCDKLKKYTWLDNQIDKLIPQETYVKYIKTADAFKDKKYETHIKAGGILLAGGIYQDKFVKKIDSRKWTHLMLKYDPDKVRDKNGNLVDARLIDPIIFVIKLNNNYVFYRNFERKIKYNDDKRNRFEDIFVELVK